MEKMASNSFISYKTLQSGAHEKEKWQGYYACFMEKNIGINKTMFLWETERNRYDSYGYIESLVNCEINIY